MANEARHWTCLVLEAIDGGLLSADQVAEMCLKWMSEDDVREMCHANDLDEYLNPEEEEVSDPMDDFNYVGSRHHY